MDALRKKKGRDKARPMNLCVRSCRRRGNSGHLGIGVNEIHGFVRQDPILERNHQVVLLVVILDGVEILAG